MVLSHQTLSIFLSFQHQIERFYVIGSAKQRATNVFSTSKAREHMKRKSDILSLNPLYF
jgi:hypothetical protein